MAIVQSGRTTAKYKNAATYYVSTSGSDSNSGTSSTSPWQTMTKVNAHTFVPGDTVLFNGGQTFSGQLYIAAGTNGTRTSPITIGSYGNGQATITSSTSGIYVYDRGGVVIENLTITGASALSAGGGGVFLYADGGNTYSYMQISNCNISGFGNGAIIGSGAASSGFTNVFVSNTTANGNRDNGIFSYGSGTSRVHSNVFVSGCTANSNLGNSSNTTSWSGSGITLGNVSNGLITLCTATGNGTNNALVAGGPVGIWCYASTGVTIANCVAYGNKTGTIGDGDGFDLDISCNNCIIEYCLAYGNYGAGILAYGTDSTWTGNIIRYNTLWGNGQNPASAGYYGDLTVSGASVTSLSAYNNTIVSRDNAYLVPACYVNATAASCTFQNNIFYANAGPSMQSASALTTSQMLFQGNDYWGNSGMAVKWGTTNYSTLGAWQSATSQEKSSGASVGYAVNPMLNSASVQPAVTSAFAMAGASALGLQPTSPMIGTGLATSGTLDYFGNAAASPYCIGSHYLSNVLNGDSANFEGGTVGYWTIAYGNTVTSISSASATSHSGTHSMAIMATSAGAPAVVSPYVPVSAGNIVSFTSWMLSNPSRSIGLQLIWNSTSGYLSSTAIVSGTDAANTWTQQSTGVFVAPSGAVQVAAQVFVYGANSNEVTYLDDCVLQVTSY